MTTSISVLVVLSIMLAACRGTPSPAATPSYSATPAVTGPSTTSVAPEPAISTRLEPPMPPATDDAPRSRRDPFEPLRAGGASARRPSMLTSARLTGIVRGPGGALALVETLDGTGFILHAGEDFGEGRLLDIGEDFALFDVGSPSASMPTLVVLRLEPAP